MQAWSLRRLISTYNYLTRRPHVPRERVLRRMMRAQGLDVDIDPTPPGKESQEAKAVVELEECDDYDADAVAWGEEDMEEEAQTEDECA